MKKVDITCVYCGYLYPEETPTSGAEVLTEHIKVCDKHPMREAEQTIMLLRDALVGLVGSDNREELKQMEAAIRLAPVPDEDKVGTINAIHVIIKTQKKEASEPTVGGIRKRIEIKNRS